MIKVLKSEMSIGRNRAITINLGSLTWLVCHDRATEDQVLKTQVPKLLHSLRYSLPIVDARVNLKLVKDRWKTNKDTQSTLLDDVTILLKKQIKQC